MPAVTQMLENCPGKPTTCTSSYSCGSASLSCTGCTAAQNAFASADSGASPSPSPAASSRMARSQSLPIATALARSFSGEPCSCTRRIALVAAATCALVTISRRPVLGSVKAKPLPVEVCCGQTCQGRL